MVGLIIALVVVLLIVGAVWVWYVDRNSSGADAPDAPDANTPGAGTLGTNTPGAGTLGAGTLGANMLSANMLSVDSGTNLSGDDYASKCSNLTYTCAAGECAPPIAPLSSCRCMPELQFRSAFPSA